MRALAFMFCCLVPMLAASAEPTGREVIDQFYRHYLGGIPAAKEPPFSKAFLKLRARNDALCKKEDGVCGFGADADPYLNAQDYDEHLTYETAGVKVTEPKPSTVTVRMNVNPGYKEADPVDYYDVTITYIMVRESGHWVVDDIRYAPDDFSARNAMREEINLLEGPH